MTVGDMDKVEIFDTDGKGRGLKAKQDLLTGDVVFAEPAYAAVVFDNLVYEVCHCCFKKQAKLQRCGQCKFAHYCDRTCQRAAWTEHKNECLAIRNYGQPTNETVRLASRILWRVAREGDNVSEDCLSSLADLQDHVDDLSEEEKSQLMSDVEVLHKYWRSNDQRFDSQSISHIFGMINCNGFTISDQRGLQAVGVGLFPNLCLVNHDCWPNCTVILNNGKIELRAIQKIKAGEELTVSYVDFLKLSAERRTQLKKHYYFDCTCEHCTKGIKDDLMQAVKEEDGKKPSGEIVKEVIEFSKMTLEKIDKDRSEGLWSNVVKLCRDCLKKQEPVLADTNLYQLKILSLASEVLSYLQHFEEAAGDAKRMVQGYQKLYHHNNAQLGMSLMRAGVTHWHAGLIEPGHAMICQANGILLVTHGPTHPITKDVESMRCQTEMELRMFKENEFLYYQMREAALKNQKMQMMAEPAGEYVKELFHRRK
ncbi:histone-lysine N-methyltransferase Smyd1-like isoform X2 [Chiloscyllium plagiosum]|uniref:histone-lysine N-methyltransferase Smyd1-like isoform X2 n=1 Tax=Chiloscyllium plagiosum TaxID=36176 RepID=UPI001CB80298|nr:histone-lysine N-methyltransferase Smyd1-like isoform X2 [Chiloscyllium plagiosum]